MIYYFLIVEFEREVLTKKSDASKVGCVSKNPYRFIELLVIYFYVIV